MPIILYLNVSKKELKIKCNNFNQILKDTYENKNHPEHKIYLEDLNNSIYLAKNSNFPAKCKDAEFIKKVKFAQKSEGSHCYILDKLKKADKGGIVTLEKARLVVDYQKYIKPYEVKGENNKMLLVVSQNNLSDTIKENLESNFYSQDNSFLAFALGDKEVPNFD